jgi:hypothetical protein
MATSGVLVFTVVMTLPQWRSLGAGHTTSDDPARATSDALVPPLYPLVIKAINSLDGFVQQSYDNYVSGFDVKTGIPTSSRPSVTSVGRREWPELTAIDSAVRSSHGGSALDTLARQYSASGDSVIRLTKDASFYYDQQLYKDDNGAKGHALHAPLLAAYHTFFVRSAALRDEVTRIRVSMIARHLADLKAHGSMLAYGILLNLEQSRAALHFIEADAQARDVRHVNLDTLGQFVAQLDSSLQSVKTLAADSGRAARELSNTTLLSQHIKLMESFLKANRYLYHSLRDNTPLDQYQFQLGTGSEWDLIEMFNALVDDYNSLIG